MIKNFRIDNGTVHCHIQKNNWKQPMRVIWNVDKHPLPWVSRGWGKQRVENQEYAARIVRQHLGGRECSPHVRRPHTFKRNGKTYPRRGSVVNMLRLNADQQRTATATLRALNQEKRGLF